MLTSILLALKMGLFLPSPDSPFKTWFYLGKDLVPVEYSDDKWNVEGGFTVDMVKVPSGFTVNGKPGEKIILTPSYLLNAVVVINKDCDLGMGVRYRSYSNDFYPQLVLSFKFNSLVIPEKEYPYNTPYKGIRNSDN